MYYTDKRNKYMSKTMISRSVLCFIPAHSPLVQVGAAGVRRTNHEGGGGISTHESHL